MILFALCGLPDNLSMDGRAMKALNPAARSVKSNGTRNIINRKIDSLPRALFTHFRIEGTLFINISTVIYLSLLYDSTSKKKFKKETPKIQHFRTFSFVEIVCFFAFFLRLVRSIMKLQLLKDATIVKVFYPYVFL